MKKAKVAIITRTKDRPILLERAIKSVCSQTFRDWVMVIVNDGGNPTEVNQLVEKYSEWLQGRIEVIHHENSYGMEAASNRGIKAVDSEYILIHDDDDSLHEHFLEKTVNFLESPLGERFEGVATKVVRVIEEIVGDKVVIKSKESWKKEVQTICLAEMAILNNLVPISLLYRRRVHEIVGYYNESLPVLGDWEFYLRFLSKFDIYLLHEELANYHHRLVKDGNYSNTVIGGVNQHLLYDTLIRNELLRRDIEAGKLGLGYLVNLGKMNQTNNNGIFNIVEEAKQSIIRQLKHNKVTNVVLYGTGGFAKDLFSMLMDNRIRVELFVDSNESLWGKTLFDIEIVSIKEAANRGYDTFVIGSHSFTDDIAKIIQDEYLERNRAFRIFCA